MLRVRGRFICALKKKLPRIFLNEKKYPQGIFGSMCTRDYTAIAFARRLG